MDWRDFRRIAPHAPADDRSGVVGDHHTDYQPRVLPGDASGHGGQWTKSGGAAAIAPAIAAPAMETAPTLMPALRGLAAGLSGLLGSAVALAGGLILIPLNRSQRDSGLLPDDPDVHYDYDQGFLTVRERAPDGNWETIFHGRPDRDGYYVTPDGAMIGRALDNGVYLSAGLMRLEKRAKAKSNVRSRAKDEPRYCPDPGPDKPSGASAEAQFYQVQISGLPPGIPVEFGGVMFDGCDELRRVLLEAKAEGFAWALRGDDWPSWYEGRARLLDQLERQSRAAGDRIVEWHVAEKPVADVLRRLASELNYTNIHVLHTPAIMEIVP